MATFQMRIDTYIVDLKHVLVLLIGVAENRCTAVLIAATGLSQRQKFTHRRISATKLQ